MCLDLHHPAEEAVGSRDLAGEEPASAETRKAVAQIDAGQAHGHRDDTAVQTDLSDAGIYSEQKSLHRASEKVVLSPALVVRTLGTREPMGCNQAYTDGPHDSAHKVLYE